MTKKIEMGAVASLWRYPVKSMSGERLADSDVGQNGFFGDRGYALIDKADGKVVTAKNPKKWPALLECQVSFIKTDQKNSVPAISIRFPDGAEASSEHPDIDQLLSQAMGREVFLAVRQGGKVVGVQTSISTDWIGNSEEYHLNLDDKDEGESVTDFELPEGTFFDCARVHLLTTATIARLKQGHPGGQFEIQRFRPNIVVESIATASGFVENDCIGHTLAIGREVRLHITGPCPRCVMTTLPQGELPKDIEILRTAVQHNQGNVGVYAAVLQGGTICEGDAVHLEETST